MTSDTKTLGQVLYEFRFPDDSVPWSTLGPPAQAEWNGMASAVEHEVRVRLAAKEERKTAPIQGERGVAFPGRVPWVISARAWGQYAALGHGDQSHERLCERGGFGVYELVHLLNGRNPYRQIPLPTAEEIAAVRDECEGLTDLRAALAAEKELASAQRRLYQARLDILVVAGMCHYALEEGVPCPRCSLVDSKPPTT
jgi:hypothetical protein